MLEKNLMRTLILTSLILVASMPSVLSAADIFSYAIVNDDATLRIRGHTIHLYGIYIPSTERICRTNIVPARCAHRAALALDFKINSHFVRCEPMWKNEDRSITAICTVDDEDLAAYLITRGWALALPEAPFEYTALEKIARSKNLGVWGIAVDQSPRGYYHWR
jgi:endonuclease YncB( thermonuclease family)